MIKKDCNTGVKYAFIVLSAIALSACVSVGPDYRAQTPEFPQSWSDWHSGAGTLRTAVPAQQTALRADWWTLFHDATLNDLEARALKASPDLRTAALHFAQSRLQRQTVAAQHGPAVNLSGQASRQRQSENGTDARMLSAVVAPDERPEVVSLISSPLNLYQAGFDASWELDIWGRVRRAIESADAGVEAMSAAFSGIRLSITSDVARNYFALRATQQQIRILRQDIEAVAESLQLVTSQAKAGAADALAVDQQRAVLADLKARLPLLLGQESRIMNQIALLLGEHPGTLQAVLDKQGRQEFAVLPDLSLGIPSEVARYRPDIRQAEAELHAATANIGIARADLYPRITLGASFGSQSIPANKFGEWGSRVWSVGPSINLPIFDMGRRLTTVELRKLEQQEAAIAYQKTVLRAWQEIDDTLSAYGAEWQSNGQLQKKLHANQEAYTLAKVRYTRGLTDFLAVLEARRVFLKAQSDLAESNSQLRGQLIAVYKAVGGGDIATVQRGATP